MNKDTLRQAVNVIATLVTITVNGLAVALPLNGQNTGAISDRFKVFFVPAGYVFSIWGVIYLAMLAFTIYQALPSQRENPRLRRIGYLYALSGLANSTWLFLWHYNYFVLSLFVMLSLLSLLIAIYVRLDIGRSQVPAGFRWAVNLLFSLYLGWISVATIANATGLLYYLNWNGWGIGGEVWAVIMLGAASIIAVLMSLTRADVVFLLVLVWAFAGIALKQAGAPLVVPAAWAATILAALLAVFALVRGRQLIKVSK